MKRQQEIEHELESVGDDLDRMGELLGKACFVIGRVM